MDFSSQALHAKPRATPMSGTRSEIDCDLLKAMHIAAELLGMLRRSHRDPSQARQISADIIAVARWITLLIARREDVERNRQRFEVINVWFGGICERCRNTRTVDSSANRNGREAADLPTWTTQLPFLLACTETVTRELFEQDCAFRECLAKLWTALRRQRRYLSSKGAGAPRIEVHKSDMCSGCGQVVNPSSEAVL